MVEEKAIFSIEKFLISRRLMYWQVYLHKTVVSAEMSVVLIFKRVLQLLQQKVLLQAASKDLDFFLQNRAVGTTIKQHLDRFCRLDDHDVMASIKNWCHHPDKVLSTLSRLVTERKLLKIRFLNEPVDPTRLAELRKKTALRLGIAEEEADYFVFTGNASNTTYNPKDERIHILFKDGSVKDISEVDNALINYGSSLAFGEISKEYICYPGDSLIY